MSNLHGQIIRGYLLEDIAGSGGFGTVYHARQEILNREVAVKVINEKYVNKPQFIRQFESEARIIARLEHLHIVTLYDYWRDPSGAYLIMRWLKGGSLRQYLKHQQMTIPQIVRLLNQISSALAFGHQQNVIHRDIKPENILLDESGNAFLTDFGIAVDLQNQENLDIENISFGSPDYVAPEQLTDKLITPKADIYSLGIMLYELLAHERPFRADTAKEVMQMQLRNPVPSLRLTRPDLPTEIDTIIWQATSKRPHSRYDSILELAIAFQNIATTVSDVPSEYNIQTETRRRHRQNIRIKPLSGDSAATGIIGGLATDDLEGAATGVLDFSTGILEFADEDAMATGVLDDAELSGEHEPEAEDAMATGVLDDTDLSEIKATGKIDEMATGVLQDAMATGVLDEEQLASASDDDYVMTVEIVGEGSPNPYKGLNAFEEGDADTFFGRENIVKQLLTQFAEPKKRFLALIGPSGSGKSSIVRAGLIPQFRKNAIEGSSKWYFSTMVPGDDPFREMSEALLRVSISAPENWGQMLRKNVQSLHKLLGLILPEDDSQLLLFIDQFEEVFTLWEEDKEREIFLGSLWYAINQPDSRLRLIITLRADFYDRPLHYPQFGELLRKNTEVVLPLNFQELGKAILEPANKVGLKIEPKLANALLEDVHNQPGALPLLQYTLTELYEKRNKELHELRYAEYEALGGISGALAERAQEIYFSRLNDDEQALAQQLFLRLISIDENGTATRRRAYWHELMQGVSQEQLENVINAFSRHRLLTTDSDPTTRIPTIEVAHEALISAWKELRTWIEDNRHALQKRQELRVETDRWDANDRDNSYLASGVRLAEFENLLDNPVLALRKEELDYIDAGIYERDAELRQALTINRRLRNFSIAVGILAIAAIGLFIFATLAQREAVRQSTVAQTAQAVAEAQQGTAEANARTAFSREIAASALSVVQEDDLSLLLSVEAYSTAPTYEALNSLLLGLQEYPYVQSYLSGHQDSVRSVDYNSDGSMAVSAGADEQIIRWDMTTHQMIGQPMLGHTGTINAVAFSPDDSMIASVSDDDTVRLWNAQTGDAIATLEGHKADVWELAFSPDGQYLATCDEGGTIIVWNLADQSIRYTIEKAHDGSAFKVLYNADGTILASGGADSIVRLWNADTGAPIRDLVGHQNWVRAMVFHHDRPEVLITGDTNSNIIFWDTNTGEALGPATDTKQTGGISDLAFHPSGYLASAGFDGTIILYNLKGNTPPVYFVGHQAIVRSIDFSSQPDVISLISGSDDTDVISWNYSPLARPVEGVLLSPGFAIDVFKLNKEKGLGVLVGGLKDKLPSIQIWDINAQPVTLLHSIPLDMMVTDPNAPTTQLPVVSDLALSSDGTRLAALMNVGNNGIILVWNAETAELLWSKTAYSSVTKSLAFINDDSEIISSDATGHILFWNVETGDLVDNALSNQPNEDMTTLTLSPDKKIVAIAYVDKGIRLWDLEKNDWLLEEPLKGHDGAINVLQFDDSGKTLYSGAVDKKVISWDLATDKQLEVFQTQAPVLSIAINPSGTLMVSGYDNGNIRLWDTKTGRAIGNPIQSAQGNITDLFFTDETTIIGSNRENWVVLRWSADVNKWIQQACQVANRSLTSAEQEQYIPPEMEYTPHCSS